MTTPFDPADIATLFNEMTKQAAGIAGKSWLEHKEVVSGYLHDLAGDAIKVRTQLATGKIDAQTAAEIMAMQQRARRSLFTYVELSGLQTAQKILDMATGLVVNAIRARTGVDILGLASFK